MGKNNIIKEFFQEIAISTLQNHTIKTMHIKKNFQSETILPFDVCIYLILSQYENNCKLKTKKLYSHTPEADFQFMTSRC